MMLTSQPSYIRFIWPLSRYIALLMVIFCGLNSVHAQVLVQPLGGEDRQELIIGESPSKWQLLHWLTKPKNYSQCILKNVSRQLPEEMVDRLKYLCYKNFPPRGRSLFKPQSIDVCFREHRHKAGGRKAAGLIYGACEAYFKDIGRVSSSR